MPIDPQSPEFARLAARWLDGSATLAEAAQLWESVKADPACAREFAGQARFELLLQDTLAERARERGINASAQRESSRRYQRTQRNRALAVAAAVIAAGFALWLIQPNTTPTVAESGPHVELPLPPTSSPPHPTEAHSRRTTILVARETKSANQPATVSLKKHLDDFFLTEVNLEKVPLRQALKLMEDQLRELNFSNSQELAALRVRLPQGAGDEVVSFHSGGISFLKAIRAIGSLAGYDLDVDDTSLALVARANPGPMKEQSHSLESLASLLGTPEDPTRNRMAELIGDARSLGLHFDLNKDGTPTHLYATPGELEALSILAQSRDQIRSMPPLQFYVRATRGGSNPDRIVTGTEADRIRAEYLRTAGPNPPVISLPMLESNYNLGSPQKGDVVMSAGPVGDQRYIVFAPTDVQQNQVESGIAGSIPASTASLRQQQPSIPTLAIIKPPDVLQFSISAQPQQPSVAFTVPGPSKPASLTKQGSGNLVMDGAPGSQFQSNASNNNTAGPVNNIANAPDFNGEVIPTVTGQSFTLTGQSQSTTTKSTLPITLAPGATLIFNVMRGNAAQMANANAALGAYGADRVQINIIPTEGSGP